MLFDPKEFKLVSLRECPWRDGRPLLETPDQAADYWRRHIATEARFNPDRESLAVLMLNTRRRLLGHVMLGQGTKDTCLVNGAEIFRLAVVANAAAILVMHNHPSGDPTPSQNDLKLTRGLRRAGDLIQVEVLDHVIMGKPSLESDKDFASLKVMGYFWVFDAVDELAAEGGASTKLPRELLRKLRAAFSLAKAAGRTDIARELGDMIKQLKCAKGKGGSGAKAAGGSQRAGKGRPSCRRRGQLEKDGWVPLAASGIRNPGALCSVKNECSTLKYSEEVGFCLFDKRRECTLNGKPCREFDGQRLLNDPLLHPESHGMIKLRFSYGPERTMVKRLTRREAVTWAVAAFLPECLRGDVVVKAASGGKQP